MFGYRPCSGVQPLFGAQFPRPHIHPHSRPSGAALGWGLGVCRGGTAVAPTLWGQREVGVVFYRHCHLFGDISPKQSHSEGNRGTALQGTELQDWDLLGQCEGFSLSWAEILILCSGFGLLIGDFLNFEIFFFLEITCCEVS